MPHLSIEYSPNLEGDVDIQGLCECLRAAAAASEVFPMPGVRVRAYPAAYFAIADGDPKHGFIDISVRLRGGRAPAAKAAATEALFAAVRSYLDPVFATRSIALSLEMRDIDPELSPKDSTIRAHLSEA